MNKGRIRDYEPSHYDRELRITIIFILLTFFLLLARIVFLQVVIGDELFEKSLNNYIRERTMMSVRGSILDCNGEVLASDQPAYNVIFFPGLAVDVNKLWETFKQIYAPEKPPFGIDAFTPKNGRAFEVMRLERNISRLRLAKIEARAYELPSVSIEVAPIRVYERGMAAAHLLGYMGEISPGELREDTRGKYKLGAIVGKKGVEKTLDLFLRGEDGAEQLEVNVKGREERVLGRIAPVAGHNVILNIDAKVQDALYLAMGEHKGAAVMLDVNSGAVIALLSMPSFDPNIFSNSLSHMEWSQIISSPDHPLENRVVAGLYPPASAYKPFIAIAALEEGTIDKETSVYCRGGMEIGGNLFRCWRPEGHGRINTYRAIVESCDVFFYNIARSMGVDVIAQYARAFGFGSFTGMDLDREKSGLVPTKEWKLEKFKRNWMLGDTVSVVIGQGYNLVTPIQLVVAYAAIANGGILWHPQIVRKVVSVDGKVIKEFTPSKKGEIKISPENLALVRKGLWGVVNDVGGTGAMARIAGVEVCGKTGTAQVVSMPRGDKTRRKRPPPKDHAIFAAYAPCNQPEVAIVVILENAGHGGAMAAPIARAGLESYFKQKRERAAMERAAATGI